MDESVFFFIFIFIIVGAILIIFIPNKTKKNESQEKEIKNKQPVIIKNYKGDENSAREAFNNDIIQMQKHGYYPTSINYIPGSWGCGSFLIAALLLLILIGIIVFIYMLIVKPDGYLTVTYELREKEEEKTCPMCAEKVKYEAIICKHCGHELPPNPIVKDEIKRPE